MKAKLIFSIIILMLITACGLNNTMYNARNYFKSAQARPLNTSGRPSPQAIEDYTKTIQKCGIIITERKSGQQVEEALYLMARALYYKGNSAFQAKDQFENLIRLFPESKYVPDANIYLARVLREINQAPQAEVRLEEFVRNPIFVSHHPRALLVLADFEIRDKDYLRADYFLQRIVTDYAHTKEAREALFLIGKNYYEQKDYSNSLESFNRLTRTFRLDRVLRLDAQYYQALNHLQLGSLEAGLSVINLVIKNEARLDRLGFARVLRGRLLIASGKNEAGMAELDAVLREYPRTPASSEAAFFLGDYHFYKLQDRTAANTNYNRVRTESPTGSYVTRAQAIVAALQQLGQGANLNSETNLQQFLDYHYLAADNYAKQLNLPDSSLVLYQRVINEREVLIQKKATIELEIAGIRTQIDSLLLARTAPADSSSASADTLQIDSRIRSMNSEIQTKENRITSIGNLVQRFDDEIIPFVWFVKANLRMTLGQKEPEVAEILQYMRENYPGNKHTNAIRMLYEGQRVRVVDPEVEEAEARLDFALGLYPAQPDSMVSELTRLLEAPSDEVKLRANFRLGWYYAIDLADSSNAREYLTAVLESSNSGDYGDLSRRIFDGTRFLIFGDAPSADSTTAASLEEELQSSDGEDLVETEAGIDGDSTESTTSPLPEAPAKVEENPEPIEPLEPENPEPTVPTEPTEPQPEPDQEAVADEILPEDPAKPLDETITPQLEEE